MTAVTGRPFVEAGVDAVTCKPAEMDLDRRFGRALDVDLLAVDYEGREHVPEYDLLADLAGQRPVRLTAPVRADGFDPHGDDSLLRAVPESVGLILVAGHPAYLSERERGRAIAPRLRTAAERASDPWVGSEGVERVAMAVGGTQYDLLSRRTEREARALRDAGFSGRLAVYAPVVFSDDPDAVLDAVGGYAARRPGVRRTLPAETPTDSAVAGEARETLLEACRGCALVGDVDTVAKRVRRLKESGIDTVVAYPARGLDPTSPPG